MDQHVKDYYRQSSGDASHGHFHRVITLHDNKSIHWDEVIKLAPDFNRGWFELAHFSSQDRIDFTRDFWSLKMPFHPKFTNFIDRFFSNLDDIGLYIIQPKFEDPFECHMIYSLKEDRGFFRGLPPVKEQAIATLQAHFPNVIFPNDFIAFSEIHNGFCKTTDTGIIPIENIQACYANFQESLLGGEVATTKGEIVNPKTLIPFYESFGMPFYQCFWEDWYPENEMGNVYYSGLSKTISHVKCLDPAADTMAFATFADWLMFYLESIEL